MPIMTWSSVDSSDGSRKYSIHLKIIYCTIYIIENLVHWLDNSCDASISTIQKAYGSLTHNHRSTFKFRKMDTNTLFENK